MQMVNPEQFTLARVYEILIEAGKRDRADENKKSPFGDSVGHLLGANDQETNCNDKDKCTTPRQ